MGTAPAAQNIARAPAKMTTIELTLSGVYVAAVLCLMLVYVAPPIKRLCDLLRRV